MAVTQRAAAGGNDITAGGQITIPSTVETGDLLLVVVDINSVSYTIGDADQHKVAGWDCLLDGKVIADGTVGGSQFASVYGRYAQPGDADTVVTFPVTPNGSKKALSLVSYYASTVGKRVNIVDSVLRGETSSTSSHATNGVTVAATPATLVSAIGKKGTTVSTITAPSGYTLFGVQNLTAGSSNNGTAWADRAAPGTGAQFATWTVNVANSAATTFLLVLEEGDPPPLPQPVFRVWTTEGWSPAP